MQVIIGILIAGIISNNMVLVQGWGICPFLGVSKKTESAIGMGLAVIFVNTIAALICSILYFYVLKPFSLTYLNLLVFILVISSLVQLLEVLLKRFVPALYNSLGVYLPLITTNCAILNTVQSNIKLPNVLQSTLMGVAIGIGFLLAMVLMAGVREKLSKADIAKPLKGFPIALLAACVIALAFSGLGGLAF